MAQFCAFCTCRVAPSSGTLAVSGINIWERICSLLHRWRNHLWAEPCTFNLEYHCVPFVKERGKEKGKENGKRRKRKGKEKGERKKGELTPEKGVTSIPLLLWAAPSMPECVANVFQGCAIYAGILKSKVSKPPQHSPSRLRSIFSLPFLLLLSLSPFLFSCPLPFLLSLSPFPFFFFVLLFSFLLSPDPFSFPFLFPKRTCRIPLLLPFGARTLALGFDVRTSLTLWQSVQYT